MMAKPTKYRAKKQVVDGITFASQAEARRYGELKILQQAGKVSDLQTAGAFRPSSGRAYPWRKSQIPALRYVADFRLRSRRRRESSRT
jgi:hypothetical protein